MAIQQFAVVQPGDLGSQFVFDAITKKWKIIGAGPSTDANNLLTAGSDGSSYLSQAAIQGAQLKYTFAYNSTSKKIELLDSTGAVVSQIDPISIETDFGDVSINGSIITFHDATDPSKTYVSDFGTYLIAVAKANTNAIALSGLGTSADPLTATLTVDPLAGNLLKVTVTGAKVDPADVLALINANLSVTLTSTANTLEVDVNGHKSTASIINSNTLAVNATAGTVDSTINGVKASASAVQLVNSGGTHIAYALQ